MGAAVITAGGARRCARSVLTISLGLIAVALGGRGCAPRLADTAPTVRVTDVDGARDEARTAGGTAERETGPDGSQAEPSEKASVDLRSAPARFAVKGMPAGPLAEELKGKVSVLAGCVSGCKPKAETGIEPITSGWIVLEWSIDPSGAVKNVRVVSSELGSPSAEACMAAAIAGLTFASHAESSDVVVTWPMHWAVPPCPIDAAGDAK